ncbi:MAG TPA: hypothetical protein VKV32_16915 [Stellaceae bacterium]|nr:hypothetical protein [Stellaceae bacterium]
MASALLKKLRRGLADLIDPESDREPQPKERSRAVSPETLYDRIRILVPAGRDPTAKPGHVNLISMARIKERLGARWPHHAVNADRIARNAIERYLLPGDIFARWKDAGYIVVFASLDVHQAQIKCMLIGDEITKRLLGEEESDLSEVHGVEVQPDGELSFHPVQNFEQLVAQTIGVPALQPSAPKLDAGALDAAAPPVLEMEYVPSAPGEYRTGDLLADIDYRFRPSWDPGRGVIAAYLCVPQLWDGASGRRREAWLVLGNDTRALEELDFAVLDHVIGVLQGIVREKRRLLLTVPVRFETLTSGAHRRHYIDKLARLGSDAAALLVVELIAVPDGVPQARLLEIASPLRAQARAVIARLRPDTVEFSQFAGSRIAAVGYDLSRQTGAELAVMQQMARFSRGAAKAGIATYVRGVRSVSLATAALGAGFAHLDGDAIAAPVDQPRGIVEFSLLDLYDPPFQGVVK